MKRKVLFIDRDGTLIIEPEDFQIDSFDKLRFLPNVITNLSKLSKELDYELVMVSNQDGLGTVSFPENTFYPVQNFILQTLKDEGIIFNEILIDKSFEEEGLETRKPGIGMLYKYIYGDYDLENSYVIGDRITDVMLAKNLGAKSIFISNKHNDDADFVIDNWNDIYQILSNNSRVGKVSRKTKETNIDILINLDNPNSVNINTGLKFFDHMLEQIAKHGEIGLNICVKGDLEVDEHHTIEDTGIALGEALKIALGNKKGIERYGFTLSMDDCLSQVALDFGGRSWLIWEVDFIRERIGDVPTEMFFHFFKSLSDSAQMNLNIKSWGDNEHHKIESIFKAFGKSIKMAKQKNKSGILPTTKGIL